MELHTYINILKQYWKLIVFAPIAAALLALGATYLFTTYSAMSTLQVYALDAEPRVTNVRLENGDAAPPIDSNNTAQVVTASAIERIKSRDNAARVVEELRLDEPQKRDNFILWIKWFGRKTKGVAWDIAKYGTYRTKPRFEAAVDAVEGSISAKQVKNSYVIEVSAKASSPDVASDIANTAVQKYVETARQDRAASLTGRTTYLTNQTLLDIARADEIRARLSAFQVSNDFVSGSDQLSSFVSSSTQLESQIRDADAALSDARARLAISRSQLTTIPREVTSSTETTTQTSPNPVYQSLQTASLSIDREVASLEARRSTLGAALEQKAAEAGNLVTRDSQVGALELELGLVESALATNQASLNSARLAQSQPADQFQIVNAAIPPLYQAGPIKYMWVGAAIVMSLALAIMLAFVLDYYNLGVRGPQHAADLLGAPTLAVISTLDKPSGLFIPRRQETSR